MKHLVLGSAGQIGSSLCEYIIKQGDEVIEYDIANNVIDDLRFTDNIYLEKFVKECDIVHFLAFDVGGAKYLEKYQDSYEFITNNMLIMSNTFNLLKKYNKPFFFASSQMSELSHSSYGMLKNLGEKITKNLGGIVLRFWNVYGYEKNEEKAHVITDFIKMAKKENVIKMRTDGEESRQFLYADDCSECIYILSKKYHELDKNKNYHVTSFEWVKIIEIANIIKNISNCEIIKSDRKDLTQKNAMNEADPYILNIWQPKTSLEEGIYKIWKKM